MDNCLAIVTARGGSKRIPRKNIKNFLGKPIISYSIKAALDSGIFTEVMVSTDDLEIADVAKEYGAEVPFMRSSKNSDDYATTAEVVEEVIDRFKVKGREFRYVCCIYPTAPFITSGKLEQAYQLLVSEQADTVVPVVRYSFPIFRSFKIEEDRLKLNWPEYKNVRSQDLPLSYHDSGQFYFMLTSAFLTHKTLFTENTVPLEIPETEVQDIDTASDWEIAELKFKALHRSTE